MMPFILYQIFATFGAEKNYVLRTRPKTISDFVMHALAHLDKNDFLSGDEDSAVVRVVKLFEDQGYIVGRNATQVQAIEEMNHFIAESNHLRWDNEKIWAHPKTGLSSREHACLPRLHKDLYSTY